MDMSERVKFELGKRNENAVSYQLPSMPSDWQFGGVSLANTSVGLVPIDNPMAIGASSAAGSMVNTFGTNLWEHRSSSQNLGFCDANVNVPNGVLTSNTMAIGKGGPASLRSDIDRPFDMGWNPPSSMLKGGIFLPGASGMLPQSLSQFPADSGFIERAARFSSFNGGNFSDMMNPFGIPESMGLYSGGGGMMQGPQEVFMGGGLKPVFGLQSQKNELNAGEASKGASLRVENKTTDGSPPKNERKSESLARSDEEAKQGVGGSGNESDEAEFSGGGGQDEPSALEATVHEHSAKGPSSKKRKRSGKDNEIDQTKGGQQPAETAVGNTENQQKGDQNPTTTTNKTAVKQGKQGSQTSDPTKEEYIHVRARRGQATNSHSLAERVRREKISERMKFLQDLVPGCSKVTGKAVMLDEIINYVQSLQRQVEFLSMKLATVNPRLDVNMEGLIAKDILQSRTGPSSTLGFHPDMTMGYPLPHASQPALVQAANPVMESSSDLLRRTISSHIIHISGGFKEPTQLPNSWDEELHNVVQMNYVTSAPPDGHDVNAEATCYGHIALQIQEQKNSLGRLEVSPVKEEPLLSFVPALNVYTEMELLDHGNIIALLVKRIDNGSLNCID
ncbi:hypothetical protein SLE2022_219900 [Rubroshorea leprosula]